MYNFAESYFDCERPEPLHKILSHQAGIRDFSLDKLSFHLGWRVGALRSVVVIAVYIKLICRGEHNWSLSVKPKGPPFQHVEIKLY